MALHVVSRCSKVVEASALVVGSVGKSNGDQFRFSSRGACCCYCRLRCCCTNNQIPSISPHTTLVVDRSGMDGGFNGISKPAVARRT